MFTPPLTEVWLELLPGARAVVFGLDTTPGMGLGLEILAAGLGGGPLGRPGSGPPLPPGLGLTPGVPSATEAGLGMEAAVDIAASQENIINCNI